MSPVVACATAPGGTRALLRLAGPSAWDVARRAGVPLVAAPGVAEGAWHPQGRSGGCPVRVWAGRGPRTATGTDLVEITLPAAPDLIELALAALVRAGAEPAAPGAFTRLALAHGRLDLDRALAVLALATAPTAEAAGLALARLQGALAEDLAPVRDRLLRLRALVEAGLDFLDEADVKAYDPAALMTECLALAGRVDRWRVAAAEVEALPTVVLAGPANAGKSALFAALTGTPALVSPVAGTTRDSLEAVWEVGGRPVRLIDTAGWLEGREGVGPTGPWGESPVPSVDQAGRRPAVPGMAPDGTPGLGDAGCLLGPPVSDRPDHSQAIDTRAIAQGRAHLAGAAVILACSAPDAPLPADHGLPEDRTVILATKTDLGPADRRAALGVRRDQPLTALAGLVAGLLATAPASEPRQQRLLAEAHTVLASLGRRLPPDELLAEDLRRAADALGDLLGATTPDDVLGAIFSRFCIGK